MRRTGIVALAGAALLFGMQAASAADLPMIQQAPSPAVVEFGGWYLRGDIGFSSERPGRFFETGLDDPAQQINGGFETDGIFRLGVGYQFNSWLRADVTGEFRSPATFHGLRQVSTSGTCDCVVTEQATVIKSEFGGLANVYADLGTWWGVTPFIGAGLGFAANRLSNFQEVAVASSCGCFPNIAAFAPAKNTWNFAWALHAGMAYKVTPNLSLELAYRFLSLGRAQTGAFVFEDVDGSVERAVFHIDRLTSHDFTLGVRWLFALPPPPEPFYPLVRKG